MAGLWISEEMRKMREGYRLPSQVLVWQGVKVESREEMRRFGAIVDNSKAGGWYLVLGA